MAPTTLAPSACRFCNSRQLPRKKLQSMIALSWVQPPRSWWCSTYASAWALTSSHTFPCAHGIALRVFVTSSGSPFTLPCAATFAILGAAADAALAAHGDMDRSALV